MNVITHYFYIDQTIELLEKPKRKFIKAETKSQRSMVHYNTVP